MQSGELDVIGSGDISIALKDHPDKVSVQFIDEENILPCNPDHVDLVEFEIQKSGDKFNLFISWKVSGKRKLSWEACY